MVCKVAEGKPAVAEKTPAIAEEKIVEVRPPDAVTRESGAERQPFEPEFFPLVSAAHEFKTPLVVMLGYAELLQREHFGPVNDEQRRVLGEMQDGAERLQKFIHNLLLLYELRASNGSTRPCSGENIADVNAAVRETFNYWAPSAKQKSIAYHLDLAPGDPQVCYESLKLQHTLSSLIENALKYTPAHGQILVRVRPCFWDRRKKQTEFLFNFDRRVDRKIENAVHITVHDTGPGIPPEHHQDIFGDFFQLPGSSSRGTGLGLAIARRLTLANGGAIWVESAPGKGSKFSLLLVQSR